MKKLMKVLFSEADDFLHVHAMGSKSISGIKSLRSTFGESLYFRP